MVLPAFQDSHLHAPFAGRYRLHVSLHDLPGVDAYRDAVASYALANPEEPWIFGGGWLMAHFPGGTPTKELLDDIVPDRPVFLLNRDVHGAWVNSKALEVAHVTRETPDPWDGRFERDPATGEPTGTLHEGAAYSFADTHLPPPPREEWERAILLAQEHLHSLGITGWQDAWVTSPTEEAYRSLAERGDLTARVVGALWWDRHRGPEQIEELVARRDQGVAGTFHPTTVKIMTDGVLENHTGAMLRPYCDATGHETDETGISYLDRDQLVEAVTALDREGFQVHMHAIGDRAVRNGLDACEEARGANGARDSRHHLAHLQVVHPEDVPRFRDLGVIANCQPYWAQHDPQMDELTVPFLGPERAPLQYPFASLHAAGATLAFGSDWSVSTADPLEEMEVAIRRADPRLGTPTRSCASSASPCTSPWRRSRRVPPTSTSMTTPARSRRGIGPISSCWTATSSTSPTRPLPMRGSSTPWRPGGSCSLVPSHQGPWLREPEPFVRLPRSNRRRGCSAGRPQRVREGRAGLRRAGRRDEAIRRRRRRRRHRPRGRARGVPLAAGTLRVRQDHHPADARRLRGADRGRHHHLGRAVQGIPPHKRDVNTVFQHYALFPHMTVAENVAYGLRQKKVAQGRHRPARWARRSRW